MPLKHPGREAAQQPNSKMVPSDQNEAASAAWSESDARVSELLQLADNHDVAAGATRRSLKWMNLAAVSMAVSAVATVSSGADATIVMLTLVFLVLAIGCSAAGWFFARRDHRRRWAELTRTAAGSESGSTLPRLEDPDAS